LKLEKIIEEENGDIIDDENINSGVSFDIEDSIKLTIGEDNINNINNGVSFDIEDLDLNLEDEIEINNEVVRETKVKHSPKNLLDSEEDEKNNSPIKDSLDFSEEEIQSTSNATVEVSKTYDDMSKSLDAKSDEENSNMDD